MKEPQSPSIKEREFESFTQQNATCENLQPTKNIEVKDASMILLNSNSSLKCNAEKFSINGTEAQTNDEPSNISLYSTEAEIAKATSQNSANLFRLFVKNGEYVYARPNDIVMIESYDHLVKVYVAFSDQIKKTIRHNTLKDFLSQLPSDRFMRIGRFCAVNMHRISGGNYNEQTFEFDFNVSIKLKHSISSATFGNIGK